MPTLPEAMSYSWACCLLLLGSVLLLGQLAQGGVQLRRQPPSPIQNMMERSRQMLQKQHRMLYNQAVQAHAIALNHMNKKLNTTYLKAPNVTTHIVVQDTPARAYYINTVVVHAKCPENHTVVNLKHCEIPPESPKLECEMTLIVLFEESFIYIKGCHEYKPLPTLPVPVNPHEEEEEATPYV